MMDDGAGQTDGEAAPAPAPVPVPTIHMEDLVTFKSKGEHGDDRGLAVDLQDTPEGKISVLFVGGAVVHAEQGDLTVVDRSSLSPGQMVVSASDPGGQVGVVMGVDTALDLVESDGGEVVARGVSPAELRRIQELGEGDYVVSGPWLGRVVEVSVDVDVVFDDGAACRVPVAERKLAIVGEDGSPVATHGRLPSSVK
jgi:ubiquitin-conjugating enzyme E2 O